MAVVHERGDYIFQASSTKLGHFVKVLAETRLMVRYKVTKLRNFKTCISIKVAKSMSHCHCSSRSKEDFFCVRKTFLIGDENDLQLFCSTLDTITECALTTKKAK